MIQRRVKSFLEFLLSPSGYFNYVLSRKEYKAESKNFTATKVTTCFPIDVFVFFVFHYLIIKLSQ